MHHDGVGPSAGDLALVIDFEAGMGGERWEHERADGVRGVYGW